MFELSFRILNIVMPVFIIIGIGFALGKLWDFEAQTPANLVLYVFGPAYFFTSLVNSDLSSGELVRIAMFAMATLAAGIVIINLVKKGLHMEQKTYDALVLAGAFPNSGNYALPLILYAFGNQGVAIGVVYTAIQSILMNSVGIFYATRSQYGIKDALLNIIRVPGFSAVTLGLVLHMLHIEVPSLIERPLELLGNAMIPTILILLGASLAGVKVTGTLRFVSLAAFIRLGIFPVLAFLSLKLMFPLHSLEARVLMLSAATPTAANASLLAIKFKTKAELVSGALLVTTVASLLTVSLTLAFLLR